MNVHVYTCISVYSLSYIYIIIMCMHECAYNCAIYTWKCYLAVHDCAVMTEMFVPSMTLCKYVSPGMRANVMRVYLRLCMCG